MNQEERKRLHIAHCLIEGKMLISDAALVLNLSERQVRRIKKGVMEEGNAFIIHKNRGRSPKHALIDEQKRLVIELKNSKYQEANFAHFQKLLEKLLRRPALPGNDIAFFFRLCRGGLPLGSGRKDPNM